MITPTAPTQTPPGALTVALSYLGDFAFFAAIPTTLDPAPEPGATPVQLYLPAVMSEASRVIRHE